MADPNEVPDPERFWEYVQPFMALDACWIWTGTLDRDGYGTFRPRPEPDRRLYFAAHRLAFHLLRGPIPDGLTIDHLCLNKACVNPDHLEPVSNAENIRRGRPRIRAGSMVWRAERSVA